MPVYNPMLFLILLKIYISINVNTIALLTYIINVYIIAILYIYIHRSLLEDYEFLRVLPVPSYKDMHCANLRVCAARISTS